MSNENEKPPEAPAIIAPEIVNTDKIGMALNAVGPNQVATVAAIKQGELVAIHLIAVPAELVEKFSSFMKLFSIRCVGIPCAKEDFIPAVPAEPKVH